VEAADGDHAPLGGAPVARTSAPLAARLSVSVHPHPSTTERSVIAALTTAKEDRPFLGLHVLYADDEAVNRRLMGNLLNKLGCTYELLDDGDMVAPALQRSGQLIPLPGPGTPHPLSPTVATHPAPLSADDPSSEAASTDAAIAARRVDVVLLDIVMARSDGADVCAALRAGGINVPMVAVTGNARDTTFLLDCGFNLVVPKPFTLPTIQSALQHSVLSMRAGRVRSPDARARVVIPAGTASE
jgi:CheY-like chemotaxis protein